MNTLEVVDGENMMMLLYLKDKNNVYFEGKKMEGKNPKEFEEEMEIK